MKTYCIIGDPIEHSLSPAMHNAAFRMLNLDCVYIAMRVRKDELEGSIRSLRSGNVSGFNVTIPHKVTIIEYIDELDDTSKKVNAVNTVLVKDDKMIGYNTDLYGFIKPIKDRSITLKDKDILLFGAGGASRAVIVSLSDEGIGNLVLANRSIENAKRLIEILKSNIKIEFDTRFISLEDAKRYSRGCYMIINSTPLGMRNERLPISSEDIDNGSVVYDLVYRPMNTPLLEDAMDAGAEVIYGYEMLLEQGAKAFEIWLNIEAPRDIMKMALLGGFG